MTIFHYGIFLTVRPQADSLAQFIHTAQVIFPFGINHFQQNHPFDSPQHRIAKSAALFIIKLKNFL